MALVLGGSDGTGGALVAGLVVWQYSWWDEGYGGGGGWW